MMPRKTKLPQVFEQIRLPVVVNDKVIAMYAKTIKDHNAKKSLSQLCPLLAVESPVSPGMVQLNTVVIRLQRECQFLKLD